MTLAEYLKLSEERSCALKQKAWNKKLKGRVKEGFSIAEGMNTKKRDYLLRDFNNRIRTEEIKAWYSSPEGETLFQGTSVSSLTVPCELTSPLSLNSIDELEGIVAKQYIELHDRHADKVKNAIIENVDSWIRQGLYYGIALSSKIIAQAFQLKVPYKDVVFKVEGHLVDPHEIASYPAGIRKQYFKKASAKITCFKSIDITQKELESSLILADISKPKLAQLKDNIILAPIRCNEIASILAKRVRELIISKTKGRISPKSLAVVIFDTDTPYTYQSLSASCAYDFIPVLPGLTLMGTSGTIDAFRWLYAYRISLIGQKIMKSSLYSQVHRRFIPFVFFGVLVPRDADILLESDNLDQLRYRGNIDSTIEFFYIIPAMREYLKKGLPLNIDKIIESKVK